MNRKTLPCGFYSRLPRLCAGRKCKDCVLRKDQYYGETNKDKQRQTKEAKP